MVKGCRAEFDYSGWSKYNIWRREVRAFKHGKKVDVKPATMKGRWESPSDVDKAMGERDCWRDCDFPSECHNERQAEREWFAYHEKMRLLEQEWAKERERVKVEMLGHADKKDEMDVDVETLTFYDCAEQQSPEEEVVDAMGPIGTDCDGLGEKGYQLEYTKSRRKSLDLAAAAEEPPSSPLKACSFGFEDVNLGCNVWAGEHSCKEDEDMQLEEVLKARSMFLRKCEKADGCEKFGDEDEDI